MNKLINFSGIVLDGGESRRMGSNKGELMLNSESLTEIQIEKLKKICVEVILSTNKIIPETNKYYSYQDLIKNSGPAGGIYTGLYYSKSEYNYVLSCDMPFVSVLFLEKLAEYSSGFDVTIPFIDGRLQPLIGIYKKSVKKILKGNIEKGELKLENIIRKSNLKIVDFSKIEFSFNRNHFLNINTKEDYFLACQLYNQQKNFD